MSSYCGRTMAASLDQITIALWKEIIGRVSDGGENLMILLDILDLFFMGKV